jgi:BMFP domain-containing protein YqiC|tara:strand:+ start:7191 stop:7625 length:435 start_codon:yes stop_codon:yes gene_type:complete
LGKDGGWYHPDYRFFGRQDRNRRFMMAPRSNFIADIAQMANGAASAFGGMREEVDNLIRQRMERSLNARGLVTREEYDALRTRHEAQAAQAFLDTVQVLACDGVHLFTRLFGLIRKRQQLANIVQTETQLPAVTDKDQPRGLIF